MSPTCHLSLTRISFFPLHPFPLFQDPAKSIIHSNEAFGLYVQSLLLLNRNTDLSKAVRIRDELLTSASTSGSSNLYAPLPFLATTSTEGAQVASADANPTATGTGVAAAALPLHNAPGPVHVIVDNVTPNPATTSSKGWSAFWSAVSRGIKLFGERFHSICLFGYWTTDR